MKNVYTLFLHFMCTDSGEGGGDLTISVFIDITL